MTGISVKISFYSLKVCFGDITHLRIDIAKLVGHQSWCDSDCNFVIEYMTTAGPITCEYDSKEKWRAILKGLDDALDGPNRDGVAS